MYILLYYVKHCIVVHVLQSMSGAENVPNSESAMAHEHSKRAVFRKASHNETQHPKKIINLSRISTQLKPLTNHTNEQRNSELLSDHESSNMKYIPFHPTSQPIKKLSKQSAMPNYFNGNFPPEISEMINAYVETNNALNMLIPSLLEDSSSSEEDDYIRRSMFTRTYTGQQYVTDVLAGHPVHSYNCFRLPSEAFVQLRDMLVSRGLLQDSRNMAAAEQLAIFLRGVAHAHTYKQLCEFFQHSLETVSRYFNIVLRAIVSLSDEFINLPSSEVDTHPYVRGNPQFYPFFKNAIGAIDGTHVPAVVSRPMQNRYRNRKGFTSQNVMAAVSFDRQFVYIASGWEGSVVDMRVLRWAVE